MSLYGHVCLAGGRIITWGVMNSLENPLQLVKLCKGAALSVLLILFYEKEPVSVKYLERWSGYQNGAVSRALEFLSDANINLVTRVSRYGWQLTAYARQHPLIQTLNSGTRQNADSLATTTTATLNRRDTALSAAAVEASLFFSESHKIMTPQNDESLQLLRSVGIGEPTASRLANLDWMTPDYIRAHVENAKRKGIPTGLLIHKMRSNDPPPEIDDPEDYRRYISGPLGYLIEH